MPSSIGLVTLNARFIHSSLSLRYLRNAARRADHENVWLREFIIHQPTWQIAAEILKQRPDILGVSIYIWNRRQSFELIEMLQKQRPELKICVGGPEVSFDPAPPPGCTLIAGEGEAKWVEYLRYAVQGELPEAGVLKRWAAYGADLPELTAPYLEEDLPHLKNRYAYIETSRGCPYLCSFCLSALDEKVRYFDEEVIRDQLSMLIQAGVRKFKFVDRTFNLNPKRMKRLMQWLSRFEDREFHFEVVGDILSGDMLDFLSTVPRGVFQFEIGIQTVHAPVNERIERRQDSEKLFAALRRLIAEDRVHVHGDLIFGLPGETLPDIFDSLEQVAALKLHEVQLGFLKFLPGAPIGALIKEYDYHYLSTPPYEVIRNRDLSAEDLLYLKAFAEAFDLFYNSKRFRFSIDHQLRRVSAVDLFQRLMQGLERWGGKGNALSLESQYQLFAETLDVETDAEARDRLKLDYVYHQRVFRLPGFMHRPPWNPEAARTRTWSGDRKSPVVSFAHEIFIEGHSARLSPAASPVTYAVVHPEKNAGYFRRPQIHRVIAE